MSEPPESKQKIFVHPDEYLSKHFIQQTPYKQGLAQILSPYMYDDVVGVALGYIYEFLIAVGYFDHVGLFDQSLNEVGRIGSLGDRRGQLRVVTGLCFDALRQILFVSDQDNHRIQAFNLQGEILFTCGKEVLKSPQQLWLSPDHSTLAVVDYFLGKVVWLSAENGEELCGLMQRVWK
jgi:hypothetical protein